MPKLQAKETSWGLNYTLNLERKIVEFLGWKKGDMIKMKHDKGKIVLEKEE